MILAIEQAIVEALAEAIPALTVEAMPENPGQYAMTSALGAVLVGYQGSSYSGFTSQGGSQDREFHFEVTLLMRDLRTHQGAYAQLETIRETLAGLTFAG
jgi:hypothetical protein